MADILAALGRLEEEEKEARRKATNTGKGKSKKSSKDVAAQNASKNTGRKSRAGAPPPLSKRSSTTKGANNPASPVPIPQHLQLPDTSDVFVPSSRSPSIDPESRRISFADPPRPGSNKIFIPTKTDSLISGFPYDPRLNKYKVSEEEWKDFNDELIEAVKEAVPGPVWMWSLPFGPLRKKEVVKRIRRELQYDGDVKRVFKKWNRLFKRQRFQAWLELPVTSSSSPLRKSEDSGSPFAGSDDGGERVYRKRFNLVISPNNEKAPSVYSRNSSMTRSVTGEGVTAALARKDMDEERRPRSRGSGG